MCPWNTPSSAKKKKSCISVNMPCIIEMYVHAFLQNQVTNIHSSPLVITFFNYLNLCCLKQPQLAKHSAQCTSCLKKTQTNALFSQIWKLLINLEHEHQVTDDETYNFFLTWLPYRKIHCLSVNFMIRIYYGDNQPWESKPVTETRKWTETSHVWQIV
jgi:hypothetical protein